MARVSYMLWKNPLGCFWWFLLRITVRLDSGIPPFPSRKGDTAETTDDSNVKSEVVPPPCILGFIDTDFRVKQLPDE